MRHSCSSVYQAIGLQEVSCFNIYHKNDIWFSPTAPATNDWDSTEAYKSTDCNFKEAEFKIEKCSLSVCEYLPDEFRKPSRVLKSNVFKVPA